MTQVPTKYLSDVQVARLLGMHPASVRRWRTKNKKLGTLRYGPPYEYRGRLVVYPLPEFGRWCAQVRVINGIAYMNLPPGSSLALPVGVEKPETVAGALPASV